MDWIWSPLSSLQEAIGAAIGGSSSDSAPGHGPVPIPAKIDDHVYEVCKPVGRPSVEIVFFHGLQLDDCKEAHMTTWMSRDKSECWLMWLLDDFPEARILTVSYDGSASRTDEKGRMDKYVTGENLVQSLTRIAAVGQDGCPVLLVGHCLGGLVMKELCWQAHVMLGLDDWSDEAVDNFLINLKGLFFYGTPHNGSILADSTAEFLKGPLLGDLTTLNSKTARSNEIFRKLRKRYKWKTYGVAELFPIKLENFKGVVVPEASSRHDMDSYYSTDADHYNICKPQDRHSSVFRILVDFTRKVLEEVQEGSADSDVHSGSLSVSEVVARTACAKVVEEKLQGECACRLGIVGMGGIGKTTLARAVFQNMSNRFEYTCFFEEVKKHTVKEEKLEDLQAKIVDRLFHKGRMVKDKHLRFRWNALKEKKVLIVLDDVESMNQVRVMIESDGFHRESRLIVTSRNKRFLNQQDFEIYAVEELNLKDSKSLFCRHAFKDLKIPRAYEKRVARLVDKCGGLPLALKVVGGYLRNQMEEGVWDDVLKKLSKAQSLDGKEDDELWAKLRVSYDDLATGEKEMFLDVATCFHGVKLDEAKAAWRVCGWGSPDSGWQNLLDRCLVTEYQHHPTQPKRVWMHEHLRDLGRSMACPDGQNVQEHTRVNGISAASQLILHNKDNVTKAKVLRIVDGLNKLEKAVDLKSLPGLDELRILCLDGVYLWECFPHKFPNHLRFLSMRHSNVRGYDGRDIGPQMLFLRVCRVNSLRCLILSSPTITSFPESFGHLSQLEHLEVHCVNLVYLPESFGNLSSLQHLVLKDCEMLAALPRSWEQLYALRNLTFACCQQLRELSVGQLHALEHLEVKNCPKLTVSTIGFWLLKDLRHLDIRQCRAIGWCYELCCTPPECDWEMKPVHGMTLSDWKMFRGMRSDDLRVIMHKNSLRSEPVNGMGQLQAIEQLTISDRGAMTALPKYLGHQLHGLKQLTISLCHALTTLPKSLGHLQTLQRLLVSHCRVLTVLPESLGHLQTLQWLTVLDCPALRSLPESLGQLQALQQFTISECKELRAIPNSLGKLRALQRLTISYRSALRALPDSLWELHALSELTISDYSELASLPESLGRLQALEQLKISYCGALTCLPESLGQLRALEELTISYCSALRALPMSLGRLQALRELTISECSDLTSLPRTLGQLHALQQLTISVCFALTALPEFSWQLQSLKQLTIFFCSALTSLPEFCQLQALEQLTISDCGALTAIPESLGQLHALQQLTISECSLTALPESLGQLQALKQLEISYISAMTALPECLGRLQALQQLTITDCVAMTALPKSLGQLQALKQLTISHCNLLTALPQSLGHLQALEQLLISDCYVLTALPKSLGQLQALQQLTISYCYELRALPESLGDLQTLQELEIVSCSELTALPVSLGHLLSLESFILAFCPKLSSLPDSFAQLLQLQKLSIQSCENLDQTIFAA